MITEVRCIVVVQSHCSYGYSGIVLLSLSSCALTVRLDCLNLKRPYFLAVSFLSNTASRAYMEVLTVDVQISRFGIAVLEPLSNSRAGVDSARSLRFESRRRVFRAAGRQDVGHMRSKR